MGKEETVVKGEVFDYPVECPLSDAELLAYGDELATLDTEQKTADANVQSAKGKHKQETERIEARKQTILHRLRTKKEFKDVECYNDFDYFTGICTIRRVSADEAIKTRKMTEKEFRGERLFKEREEAEQGSNRMRDGHKPGWFNEITTTGWQKTCKCETDERVPCTVLDPFNGAGTTLLVAKRLERLGGTVRARK